MMGSQAERHAPFKKFRGQGRNDSWFSPNLSELLRESNQAWAKAQKKLILIKLILSENFEILQELPSQMQTPTIFNTDIK